MIVKPTFNMPNRQGRVFLTIGVELPDGHSPISYFRGTNVGVGGHHTGCHIAPNEPVRRATLNELRRMARHEIEKMMSMHPAARVFVQRSRH